MYSDWQAEAKKQIALIDAQFEPDTPWQERQKYLRQGAQFFHGGTSWGRKVWAKYCRAYLELNGKPKRGGPTTMFPADVTFPFRAPPTETIAEREKEG